MKKATALLIMLFTVMTTAPAFSMSPAEQENVRRQEMKIIKDKQRAEKEAMKLAKTEAKEGPREKSFWEKEGERSGLGGSGSRMGKFLRNLNPAPFFKDQDEKYKARKAKQQ